MSKFKNIDFYTDGIRKKNKLESLYFPTTNNNVINSSIFVFRQFRNLFFKKRTYLFLILCLIGTSNIFAQDSDGDGVLDINDLCNGDPFITVNSYGCDFPANCDAIEPATLAPSPSGLNTDTLYATLYILTDSVGVIQDTSSIASFSAITAGKYMFVALNYQDDATLSLVVGNQLNTITADCFTFSNAIVYRLSLIHI